MITLDPPKRSKAKIDTSQSKSKASHISPQKFQSDTYERMKEKEERKLTRLFETQVESSYLPPRNKQPNQRQSPTQNHKHKIEPTLQKDRRLEQERLMINFGLPDSNFGDFLVEGNKGDLKIENAIDHQRRNQKDRKVSNSQKKEQISPEEVTYNLPNIDLKNLRRKKDKAPEKSKIEESKANPSPTSYAYISSGRLREVAQPAAFKINLEEIPVHEPGCLVSKALRNIENTHLESKRMLSDEFILLSRVDKIREKLIQEQEGLQCLETSASITPLPSSATILSSENSRDIEIDEVTRKKGVDEIIYNNKKLQQMRDDRRRNQVQGILKKTEKGKEKVTKMQVLEILQEKLLRTKQGK